MEMFKVRFSPQNECERDGNSDDIGSITFFESIFFPCFSSKRKLKIYLPNKWHNDVDSAGGKTVIHFNLFAQFSVWFALKIEVTQNKIKRTMQKKWPFLGFTFSGYASASTVAVLYFNLNLLQKQRVRSFFSLCSFKCNINWNGKLAKQISTNLNMHDIKKRIWNCLNFRW